MQFARLREAFVAPVLIVLRQWWTTNGASNC